jgi:hypothetical protein
MRKLFIAWLILGLSSWAVAQANPIQAGSPVQLERDAFESNTVLMVELNSSVNAGKAKPGEIITATLHGDVWGARTKLLPSGSKVIGHVVEARGRSKEDLQSKLTICFDKARLKDGTEVPLNLVIRDLQIPPDVYVIRTGDNGLASLNASMSRATGPTTDSRYSAPAHYPTHSSSNSGPISSSGPAGTGSSVPANRSNPPSYKQSTVIDAAGTSSGLPDVTLVSTKNESASFSVLTSLRREVTLKKHFIVFLVPVLTEDLPAK